MGNTQPQPQQNGQLTPRDQEQKVNHPRFQNMKIVPSKFINKDQKQEDILYIETKHSVANKQEYTLWAKQLKDTPLQSEDLLLPIKHQFQNQGFCGSSGCVTLWFDNFPYVLADQIRNRASLHQKFFDQPELWYLIYTLISVGHEFHKRGKKVGDVRPQNVFINEQGQVKVATQLTWPSENVNFHKTLYQKQPTYLAPEQLKDIQYAKMQPSCNLQRAESFSIGLTCLDAGILNNSNTLYLKNNKFNYDELTTRLINLENVGGYSRTLWLVISSLCEPDCDQRSTCTELYNWLKLYEEAITNLQKFQPTNLPDILTQIDQKKQNPQISAETTQSPPVTFTPLPLPPHVISQQPYTQPGTYTQQIPVHSQTYQYQPQPQPQFVKPTAGYQLPYQQGYYIPNQQTGFMAGETSQSRGTNQTYLFQHSTTQPYSNISSTQYKVQNPPISQNYPYSIPMTNINKSELERQKTDVERTLEKIDEQLQMSRKMFP